MEYGLGEIERRFGSGNSLTDIDRLFLESLIHTSDDVVELSRAIYLHSYFFKCDESILHKLTEFLELDLSDELSAMCIKAIYTRWNSGSERLSKMLAERVQGDSLDTRFEINQAILTAFDDGDFPDTIVGLKEHLENFVSWGRLNGFTFRF